MKDFFINIILNIFLCFLNKKTKYSIKNSYGSFLYKHFRSLRKLLLRFKKEHNGSFHYSFMIKRFDFYSKTLLVINLKFLILKTKIDIS